MAERSNRPQRPRRPGRPRGGYRPRRKKCEFCVEKDKVIDYKNVGMLQNYVSEHGRIRPRRRTGTCAKHQRQVAAAIKRARHIALLPDSHKHSRRYSG